MFFLLSACSACSAGNSGSPEVPPRFTRRTAPRRGIEAPGKTGLALAKAASAEEDAGMINACLARTNHRPWPLPSGPWMMAMRWEDLLFAHWPVDAAVLQRKLPAGLRLDLFDGQAWIGLVPFRMSGTRLRGTPPIPGLASFPELNLRTYVIHGGKPGVWFFSLDAANRIAVRAARRFFFLPYMDADMRVLAAGKEIQYASRRTHKGEPPAVFEAAYWPAGEAAPAAPGSLEHWLTERYCLYAADPKGGLWRGEIHHAPWSLQPADARWDANTVAEASGISLPPTPPHLLFSRRMEVVAWLLKRV